MNLNFGVTNLRSNEPSEQRTFGTSTFGTTDLRNNGPSEKRAVPLYLYHLLPSLFNFFPNLYNPLHSFPFLVRLFFLPSLHYFLSSSLHYFFPLSIPSFFLKTSSFLPFFLFFLPTSLSRHLPFLYSFLYPFIPSSSNNFCIPTFFPSPLFLCIIPSFHSPFLFSELA